MKKVINSIVIITSPFACIPPHAIGAVERRWKSTGDYLNSKGILVTYISKKPDNCKEYTEDNLYINGYGRTGSSVKDFLLDAVYSFNALWKSPKADIVVLNTIWTPLLLPLFRWKYGASLYNVARFPKRQLGLYKAVNVLSCVSQIVYKELLRQTPSARKQVCVINNFIDTEVFCQKRVHALSGIITVVYSGRVHKEKGLGLLVEAMNEVRTYYDVRLKIIGAWDVPHGGSGIEYKQELDNLAKNWSIDWVEPIFSPKELADEIDNGDIYCYPSIADNGETFGVAPLEAMGLGMPVVVSALDCFKDFVEDGINGMVFDHHSRDASKLLANDILEIIRNKDLYEKLSHNAALTAQRFSVEQKSEEYLLVMENILNYGKTGFDEKSMSVSRIVG